jgi:hypothetical protein
LHTQPSRAEDLLVTASTQEVAQVEKFGGVGALVERLQRGVSGQQSVNVLQDTLSWGHICPTSPGNHTGMIEQCCG